MKFKPDSKRTVLQKPGLRKLSIGILTDERAWIDLLLSKVALIFASIIILAALYHLAADAEDMNQERQLETIAQDFRSAVDSAGAGGHGSEGKNYSFNLYEYHGSFGSGLDISVSGEYVSASFEENGRRYSSVKPLTYKTLPLSEEELRNELADAYSANGNQSQPVSESFGYANVTEFLGLLGTKEKKLNTNTHVHIEKTLIYIRNLNGTEVKELEYILVYQ